MSDILPVPEGTEANGVEKIQEPARLDSDISVNADEVATVQEAGLVQEELNNEEADGA
jgi:hypothetical protein